MSPETSHAHGGTKSGELVHLDYDLWAEGGGRTDLVDTTHAEVAQEAKVSVPEGQRWGPRPHLLGGEYFPSGIESALVGLKVGEEVEREFAPADAFGERDPALIELFSMHEIQRLPEMRREDAHLDVGTVLTIEGRRGRVVTLTAARVRVDFNPAFAGRKVRGKFKVVDRITEPAEQVRAILELVYGRGSEFQIEANAKSVTLRVPERSKFDISWMAAKPRVVDRLRSQLHPETIRIVEEYVTPTEPKDDTTPAKAAAEEKAAGHETHRGRAHAPAEAKGEPAASGGAAAPTKAAAKSAGTATAPPESSD